MAGCALSLAHAQSPTAPTLAEYPATIDQAWQKASSKYDIQRATLLRDVDKADQEGRFRPDWESRRLYWQTDTSFSNRSWGYINDDTFKSPEFVVHQLIDIVSKNGNLLLNFGPRSDGTISEHVAGCSLTWARGSM